MRALVAACGWFSTVVTTTKVAFGLSLEEVSDRRRWLERSAAAALATSSSLPLRPRTASAAPYLTKEAFNEGATAPSAGRFYFPTLTPPFRNRATYRYDLGRSAWAFEQLLAFGNVTATVRTNVILLESTGDLWVHGPQWPTGEFLELLGGLGRPVGHVVLPCNALEHAAPMRAFVRRFPNASVWISPGQYGPFGTCGTTVREPCTVGYRVDGVLSAEDLLGRSPPPWADEFDVRTLYVEIPGNAGPVSEVAFVHRPTKTLVATDAVVFVPSDGPPPVLGTYFRDASLDDDDFWKRSVLQSVFLPPRRGKDGDYPGFRALENRLVRAPILRAFVDARAPDAVRGWVDDVAALDDFDRVVTSHFAGPIAATPREFRACFSYLNADADVDRTASPSPDVACQDWELLDGLNRFIGDNQLGAPVVYDFKRGCRP